MQRLPRRVFWAALVLIFALATYPKPPQVGVTDKLQHMLAFACLSLLGSAAYARIPLVIMALSLAMFGAAIELAQLIPALHRSAELLDWIADMTAVAAVLLAVAAWRHLRQSD